MSSQISEGSHRHITTEQSCFFCMKKCKNWTAFQLPVGESSHELTKLAYGVGKTVQFVMCLKCKETKTEDELLDAIVEHTAVEAKLKTKNHQSLDVLMQTDIGRRLLEQARQDKR